MCLGLSASDQTTLAFTHNEELAKRGEKWIETMKGIFIDFVRRTNCGRFSATSFTILVSKISTGRH
jgi:hypothetical protein